MSILYDYDPDSNDSSGSNDGSQAGPAAVPSPCINVCKMDEARGWCQGCFRTIDELRCWSTASNDSKRMVWREIKQRMLVNHG